MASPAWLPRRCGGQGRAIVWQGKSSKRLRNFRVGTLNVNTLKGKVCEVVETLSRRTVDLCCVQETI